MCCFVVVVKEIKKWLVNSVHMNMKLIKWQKEQHIRGKYRLRKYQSIKTSGAMGTTLPRGANHVTYVTS